MDTDPDETAKVVFDEYGTPVADEPQHWLPDVALKVDFAVLESVYAMEEKITNASMQSKVRKLCVCTCIVKEIFLRTIYKLNV